MIVKLKATNLDLLKANYEAMLELYHWYKNNIPFGYNGCPLCKANRKIDNGIPDCNTCPWLTQTGERCDIYTESFYDELLFSDEISNSYHAMYFDDVGYNRDKKPKEWAKHRVNQLEQWLEIYDEEITKREQSKEVA